MTTVNSTKDEEINKVLAMLCNLTAMLRIMTPGILDLLKVSINRDKGLGHTLH